jgi:hypothetical protein
MKGAQNINPIITLQQSELRPHAGIEIEKVTATVASIRTPPRNTHADHVKSIAQGRGGCVVAIISVVVPSGVCAE